MCVSTFGAIVGGRGVGMLWCLGRAGVHLAIPAGSWPSCVLLDVAAGLQGLLLVFLCSRVSAQCLLTHPSPPVPRPATNTPHTHPPTQPHPPPELSPARPPTCACTHLPHTHAPHACPTHLPTCRARSTRRSWSRGGCRACRSWLGRWQCPGLTACWPPEHTAPTLQSRIVRGLASWPHPSCSPGPATSTWHAASAGGRTADMCPGAGGGLAGGPERTERCIATSERECWCELFATPPARRVARGGLPSLGSSFPRRWPPISFCLFCGYGDWWRACRGAQRI